MRKPAASASPAPVGSTTSTSRLHAPRGCRSRTTVTPRGAVLDDERPGGRLAAERAELGLARERDVGCELLEPREQPIRAEVGDSSRRGEVDADAGALRPSRARRARGRLRDRAVEHRVPGHVEDVAAAQPANVDLLGAELPARARGR